jgi:hypothetical protein
MTVTEFSNEFDIAYNNIATNAAPSIDLYEKSVYLTRAQLELVNTAFNPKGNKYKDGFEQSLKRRSDLNELIYGSISANEIMSDEGLEENSQFFRIDTNVYMIIQEKSFVTDSDICVNETYIKTKPVTHDEYNIQSGNPFKQPDKKVVWRLDLNTNSSNRVVELISPYNITKYRYRYVKYPSPIILTDFDTTFPGQDLSIDGVAISQTCELSISIHREIINRAAELATAEYNPKDLAGKIQINKRNE